MDDNQALAERQFDSLLVMKNDIDTHFLSTGLEVKYKLGKSEDILQILNRTQQENLVLLCETSYLNHLQPCEEIGNEKIANKALQLQLVKMYINDQYSRSNLMQDLLDKYHLTKQEVIIDSFGINTDERNRNELKDIIAENGFPTKKMVGNDGMQSIFMIIQHADGDKSWQKSQLPHFKKAVRNGDLDGGSYAYLFDRIAVNSGKKQSFGTQFKNIGNNTYRLSDLEDPENLDHRRKEVGLMPFEMYKKIYIQATGVTVVD